MKQEHLKKIINDANGTSPREIIVINGYAFYRSTGNNSGMGGVWLPFVGISEVTDCNLGGFKPGDFTKPPVAYDMSGFEREENIKAFFGSDLLKIVNSNPHLARFGNLECMIISLALDEKSWEKEELKPVKKYLQEKYPNAINCISQKYIINSQADATFKESQDEKVILKTANDINKKLTQLGQKFNSDEFPQYDACLQRIAKFDIISDEKTASPQTVKEEEEVEKESPSPAADLKKTAATLEPLLKENQFQKITASENKLTIGFSEEFKKKSHKIPLHIDLPVLESKSKNNPAADIIEELLVLAVHNDIVKIDDVIFQKIDLSYINLDGVLFQRITVHLDGDIDNDPAKAQNLINFIYGLTNIPPHESKDKEIKSPPRSSGPDIKFDGLTLDKTPLFKTWSSSENIKAVSTLDKLLQSYLELLFTKSETIREKFNRDGSLRADASQLPTVPKGKGTLDKDMEEHQFTRSLLKILRDDHLPKSKLDQFVKIFEAYKEHYFKVPPPASNFPFFKPTNVKNEIENYLRKNSLLPKVKSTAPACQ
jgi:hypothetical protein